MPYVFQETQVGERRSASEFPSLPSEVYTETFAQAFEDNPIASLVRAKQLSDDYRSGGKKLDFMSANKALKARGMEGDIKVSEAGITEDALNTLMFRKGIEKRRQEVFGQSEGGFAQGAARLGISLATGLIDPLNVATAFVPVIGEARYTSMLAKAGSTLGRAGVRLGVGAAEGVAGAAMIEPLIAGSRRYEQADYYMADSLLNVAFGGLFGAGLHSVGGAVSDGITHYRGAEPEWRGLENVSPAEIPLVQNLRQEIIRGMDARDVTRATETWSAEARRAVETDASAVTPAEAAHQSLPPQVRENALKQAIIQAVSDEPVNVRPMIRAAEMRQTQTPEFHRWFGDSKVVENDGQPLRVYHATDSNFSEFDAGQLGRASLHKSAGAGFFFTSEPKIAHLFLSADGRSGLVAQGLDYRGRVQRMRDMRVVSDGYADGSNIVPAYLSIRNPMQISAKEANQLLFGAKSDFRDSGDDFLQLSERARALGHDGIIIEPASNPGAVELKTRQYVVFRPEQIKSAIGNSGRFDPSSASLVDPVDDVAKAAAHAEKILARETDTGTPTADALKMATEEATLAQSDLKAVADRLGLEAEDAELRDVLEAANNAERWAKAAELATICLTRGG